MATIRSVLALYDGMTGPLQSIHKALNIVLNSFEAVQTASGNAIDSSAIQDAREELARAGSQLDTIEQNIRDAEQEQEHFNEKIRQGSNATDGLAGRFSQLKGAVAALGITTGIKKLVDLSDQITSTTARLSLIADDSGTIGNLEQKLNTLNQTSTVTVNAKEDGTVTAMADKLSALEQDRTANVAARDDGSIQQLTAQIADLGGSTNGIMSTLNQQISQLPDTKKLDVYATDNGTIGEVEQQIHNFENKQDMVFNVTDNGTIAALNKEIGNLPTEGNIVFDATDNGTISGIEQEVQNIESKQRFIFNATDNGTISALNKQIDNLPNKGDMVFTATDEGTVSGIEQQIQNIENYQGIFFEASDNGTITAINRKIGNVDQEVTVTVKTVGGDRVAELDQQTNNLNQKALITVNATDNGSIAAIDREIEGLDQTATVTIDITGEEQLAQIQEQASGLEQTALVTVNATDNGAIAAMDQQITDLSREAAVSMDVTANVTDNNSVEILEAKIFASAQRSRAAYLDTANAIASIGANARSAFATNDELIAFMEQINKQFVIGGASAQGQAAAMLQLTQAMGAGALRGEELNSILENAPGIARAIEQYMGVAEGSIKQYAEQGLITADVVKNAMFAAADETNAKFESMPMTWAQIWTSMQNRGIRALEPILDKINEIANSDRMQGFVDGMMNAFSVAVGILGIILDLISSVGGAIYDNWAWIEPIILGVAGALAIYYGWQLAANTIALVSKGIHIATAAAQMMQAAATGTLTAAKVADIAAQNSLNAAMYACPIMWIVILVFALVAAFYAAVAAVNHFAGTSVSATGIIGGAFAVLGAYVINTFIVPFWNALAAIANFIGNVFNDPVAAVKVLFYDMALTVVGYIKNMAEAIETVINKIPGVTVDITSGLDNFYNGLEEAQQKVKDEAGWVEYVKKMDFIDYGDAANAGYKFGEGVEDKISGLFKEHTTDGSDDERGDEFSDALGNRLDEIYGNTGDTAANTAATADQLDYMDEDLAWMRDIAEREAINRYTTAQITVEQHNENHIDKDADLDGIMDTWANDFAERLEVSGEGVHE